MPDVGAATRILGIETSCDETAAAVVDGGRDGAVVGGEQPGRPARPLRRRRARDRQPGPRRAARAGDRPGPRRGGLDRPSTAPSRSTRSPPPTGPGSSARCSSACRAAKALALAWDVPFVAVNHLEAHLYAASSRSPTSSCRWSCCSCRAATPCSSRWRTTAATGCSGPPSTTPRARPSTRSPATSASATRAARPSTSSPIEGDPRGDRASPGRCSTTGSTSPSAGSRPRW